MQPQYITLKGHAIDITGQRFGRLVALGPVDRNAHGKIRWLCQCDCGKTTTVILAALRNGNTSSCGCFLRERISETHKTHGLTETTLYETWSGIIRRCTNPKRKSYSNYGGRGISICTEWRHDFQAFHDHVSQLPNFGEPSYTLDRVNNDGNYEPGNVRWLTRKGQGQNTRTNVMLTHAGKTQSISAWAEELHIHKDCLYGRHRKGWSAEKILTTPSRAK